MAAAAHASRRRRARSIGAGACTGRGVQVALGRRTPTLVARHVGGPCDGGRVCAGVRWRRAACGGAADCGACLLASRPPRRRGRHARRRHRRDGARAAEADRERAAARAALHRLGDLVRGLLGGRRGARLAAVTYRWRRAAHQVVVCHGGARLDQRRQRRDPDGAHELSIIASNPLVSLRWHTLVARRVVQIAAPRSVRCAHLACRRAWRTSLPSTLTCAIGSCGNMRQICVARNLLERSRQRQSTASLVILRLPYAAVLAPAGRSLFLRLPEAIFVMLFGRCTVLSAHQ
mmetsp:Transcript_20023/g.42268  ORF Transcript_20023/g.42268 Transcript_20023/m.42268 type:complete len:290 (-) Transcript_20023:340-1209(-)